ncbi:hypothetical protein Droror1_Dr00024151 [Drosera rotundifolia]
MHKDSTAVTASSTTNHTQAAEPNQLDIKLHKLVKKRIPLFSAFINFNNLDLEPNLTIQTAGVSNFTDAVTPNIQASNGQHGGGMIRGSSSLGCEAVNIIVADNHSQLGFEGEDREKESTEEKGEDQM